MPGDSQMVGSTEGDVSLRDNSTLSQEEPGIELEISSHQMS